MNSSPNESFSKSERLCHQRDFDRVFKSGAVSADGVLVVHATRGTTQHSRMGISISRRVGNAAKRNYWKRLIRESFRRQKSALPLALDFVVRPKKGAKPELDAIFQSLPRLLRRVNKSLPTP